MEHAPHNHPTFVAGRDRLARLVKQLVSKNDLSHKDLEDFARWAALDEQAGEWLSKSQVSTIRNAKLPKPGPQLFLALACVNLRLAELTLPAAKRAERPPLPAHLRHLAVEPGPWYLVNPTTGQPCDEGDLFRIYCGRLEVPELEGESVPRVDARAVRLASERLALLAQGWMKAQDFPSIKAGREALLELYPVKDGARRQRLWDVIQQLEELTPEEFSEELDALRLLVGRLQGDEMSVRGFDRWLSGAA
jgi:hypothetical protein